MEKENMDKIINAEAVDVAKGSRNYLIITEGHDIDYRICKIKGESLKGVLESFCGRQEETEGTHLSAIKALNFKEAMELANEWLDQKIIMICVADILWEEEERIF